MVASWRPSPLCHTDDLSGGDSSHHCRWCTAATAAPRAGLHPLQPGSNRLDRATNLRPCYKAYFSAPRKLRYLFSAGNGPRASNRLCAACLSVTGAGQSHG